MSTRVLIIDPDINFMVGIKQALENTGEFQVTVSANGGAAEHALRRVTFDIALVDFDIPDIGVSDMIAVLRELQPRLPVILCPRKRSHQEQVRSIDAQGAIQKPYVARDLIPYIRSVLSRVQEAQLDEAAEMPDALRHLAEPAPEAEVAEPAEPESPETLWFDMPPDPLAKPQEWQDVDQAQGTELLDSLMEQHGWVRRKPARPSPEEVDHDGMQQFLATSRPDDPGSEEFGEVLDAVSQGPITPERSPQDRAFHDLVDSMRTPPPSRRRSLEDLLASIAADAAAQSGQSGPDVDSALDLVLDAIWRESSGQPPQPGSELEDATIGDVISRLFDPMFEGVLASLAEQEGFPDWRIRQEEQTAAESEERLPYEAQPPASLPEERALGPRIEEPPITSEDSSTYPATHALSAVTGSDSDLSSLNTLLTQIEQQLPLARRPRLKPLPSWERDTSPEAVQRLEAMVDRLVEDAQAAVEQEPSHRPEETQPSRAMLDEIARVPVQDIDTVPTEMAGPQVDETGQPLDLARLFSEDFQGPEEVAAIFEPESPASPGEGQMLSMADLLAMADLPVEAAPDELVAVPAETAARLLTGEISAEDVSEEVAEAEALAHIAVQLTQFSLESSAQATLLSRPGRLLAQAGDLPDPAMERLFQIVNSTWEAGTGESGSLIRFIRLPDAGEFLLYSAQIEGDLILSMIFNANTPVRTIRRQARRLSESLDVVPEAPAVAPEEYVPQPESEAASTKPSRPTDIRPPEGLVRYEQPEVEPQLEPPLRPPRPEVPYAAYTCLWLPNDPGLELLGNFADDLYYWIQEIAVDNAWELDSLDVRPDYVVLSMRIPQKTLPDTALNILMEQTVQRLAPSYPDIISDMASFWANGYYVATPARVLTEREIARFITYQRQAQMG